ncbi:MAG: ABC transporter permease subunit [Proteobacteria bacterium]|nr:ABC transporter permease subunit [Pseudomonadota bacterium]
MEHHLTTTRRAGLWPALLHALRPHWAVALLLGPLALYLLVFYLLPLAGVLQQSLFSPDFTLEHYANLWRHPVYLKVLLNTLEISFWATTAAVLLGYPLAYGMTFFGPAWRTLLMAAVTLPFWISVLVRTYSWMIILGRFGVVNSLLQWTGLTQAPLELMYNRCGVYLSLTYVLLPYAVLPMHSVMLGIDRNLLRAADSLGSSPLQRLCRVFLPLSLPGVAAAFLLTFIVGAGTFVTPTLTGGPRETVIAMSINSQLEIVNDWAFAGVLSVVLLLTVMLLFALCLRFMGLESLFGSKPGGHSGPRASRRGLRATLMTRLMHWGAERWLDSCETIHLQWTRRTTQLFEALACRLPQGLRRVPWGLWGLRTICALGAAYLILPLGVILPIAFSNDTILRFPPQTVGLGLFKSFFSSGPWMRATMNSLRVAAPVMLLATVLGTLAAMGIARLKGAARQTAYGLFISPLVLPAIINAVAMYFFMAKLKLIGTITGLVLAHTVLAVPFVIIVMTTTLHGLDHGLEQASHSLGAGRLRTFAHVTLPLIRPGLLTAAIFAFIASFDELIVALFISGARSTTLPKQMWDGIRDQMDPVIAAVAAGLIILAVALMAVTGFVRRRGNGAARPEVADSRRH